MGATPVLVIGAGSWGTALAMVLSRNGHETWLWDIEPGHIASLRKDRSNNRHLAGIPFPESLHLTDKYLPFPDGVKHVVIAAPCDGLRDIVQALEESGESGYRICLVCKGLEPHTLNLNHTVVEEHLPGVPVAVLSGPSFAREVAEEQPTAVTIAAREEPVAAEFADLFHNDVFRIYTHDDIVGVQIGGAVKNVMAIAAGIADGLNFGANTRAALISRGLAEIMRLGIALGGKPDTFYGLAGLGDLVLTCTDDQSRNRRFGLALARGKNPDEASEEIGQAVEGLRTARVVCELAARYDIDMPISEQVLKVIKAEVTPEQAVFELLSRDRKQETN